MRPIFTIPTAQHEGEVPSNAPKEELSRNAPDLHAETQSEVLNRGEREDHGTVTEGPSEAHSVLDTVKSGKSGGECPYDGTTLACIDLC